MATVVGGDGTFGWQAVRVVVVVCLAALAVRGLTVLTRRRRALMMTVLGLALIPVGVGIGLPHLAKPGSATLTFAGLAVLAGGALLLVLGATAIVAGIAGWWRRGPAIVAVLVACFVLTWSLGQAVAATNTPRPTVGSATPADRGLAYRDVTFAAADGVTLSGWYVAGHNGAAVVLLHGAGSTRSDVLDHAAVPKMRPARWVNWDQDTAGATAFLEHQQAVDPGRIAAVGLSMGGEEAIGAAATNGSIRAVVAEGATNGVTADRSWLSDEFGWRGSVTQGVDALTYGFANLLTDASPPISLHDAVRAAAPRPVLLVAASDVTDEARADRYIQSAAPDTVELWVVPDTTHTHALNSHPAEWEARVISFLDHALGIQEGSPAP